MTITAMPSAWAALETALRARQPVDVCYHGHCRLICPHALGWKAGRAMLLAYQTGGHTTKGALPADPRQRWRCMHVDDIERVRPAPTDPWQSAENYNPARPFPAIDELTIAIDATSHPAPAS